MLGPGVSDGAKRVFVVVVCLYLAICKGPRSGRPRPAVCSSRVSSAQAVPQSSMKVGATSP